MRWIPFLLAALLTTTVAVAVAPTASACSGSGWQPVGADEVRVYSGGCLGVGTRPGTYYCESVPFEDGLRGVDVTVSEDCERTVIVYL